MYWASGIAFDPINDSKPWLWLCSECEVSFEKAMENLLNAKEIHSLIDGWIEKKDKNGNMIIVYHVPYIDCFGRPTNER